MPDIHRPPPAPLDALAAALARKVEADLHLAAALARRAEADQRLARAVRRARAADLAALLGAGQ